jgi:RNA polymerase sigma-70 factor (ECF subfamily)
MIFRFHSPDYTSRTAAQLIEACTGGDAGAWQEFLRRYHNLVALTASRAARRWGQTSPQTIDDLIQETYLKLCADRGRVLRQLRLDHDEAIFGYLKIITINVVNDYFKALYAGKRGGNNISVPLEGSENEGGLEPPGELTGPERALFVDQVDACLRDNSPAETRERDRKIFWLYYKQGLTAREIADIPSVGLTLKGVESTLHRLIQLVRSRMAGALKTDSG